MIFEVTIDGHDFGFWSMVDGLVGEVRARRVPRRRWQQPPMDRARVHHYSNVKLGRATTLKYTKQIMHWLQQTQFKSKKVTASIKGFPFWHNKRDASLAVQWNLTGVLPVSWSGPAFDNQGGKVADRDARARP